ncbi:hypothetical protein C9890_0669 [Perkinsus sp. BL_2016]|nr:hypothetical protein C9890_0669 [Perkinsus sp. BL_2016]
MRGSCACSTCVRPHSRHVQGPKPPQISPGAHLRQHEVRGRRKDLQEPTHIHHAPLHPHGNIREARSVGVGRRAPPCRTMSPTCRQHGA